MIRSIAALCGLLLTLAPAPFAQGSLTEALGWEKRLSAPRWYDRTDLRVANPLFARRVLGEGE